MHSIVQTMQGMQSIMSSNMATAIASNDMKSPKPSCSSSPGSIVSASSRDSSGGSSLSSGQSRYTTKKDKHHRSKHYSQSLVQVLSLSLSSRVLAELEVFLPMGQGLAETMSKIPGYLTSMAEKHGRLGLQGSMTLPPTKGGTKKNDLMYCCLKCKVPQVIMSLMS